MTFKMYATIDRECAATCPPGIAVMAPISAWWWRDINLRRSVHLPYPDIEVAIDVGSFNFAQRFADGFPYGVTPESIVSWCERFKPAPRWVVLPDWPCEGLDEHQVAVAQQRTLDSHLFMLERYPDVPWTWVPVIQGLRLTEYARMTVAMAELVYTLRDYYAARGSPDFRVGIGSICRRGQTATIREIVDLVAAMLPGIPLHLFGVKLDVLRLDEPLPPEVLDAGSLDTGAWNRRFGSDIPGFNQGMRASGLTQRQYAWQVAYPGYRDAVIAAVTRPR